MITTTTILGFALSAVSPAPLGPQPIAALFAQGQGRTQAATASAPARDADCDGNSIPDAVEIAQDSYKDSNGNGKLDFCEGIFVDLDRISVSGGGTQTISLRASAGTLFWIIGSTAGTSPGMTLGGINVPLNYDGPGGYLEYTLSHPHQGWLGNAQTFMGPSGQADLKFVLPPTLDPTLVGQRVDHCAVLFTAGYGQYVPLYSTPTVSVTFTP